jgi:Outer membrane protein beta-barrel domain
LSAMKKCMLLVVLLLGTTVTRAQGRLGVTLSPGLSVSRVYTNPKNTGFGRAGTAFGLRLGAIYEYPIQGHCYVSTGLLYTAQHVAIKNEKLSPSILEAHALHYLQLPMLLKFYTSELMLDTRLYVALGVLGQIKINERNTELQKSQKEPFLETFRWWGLAGLLGLGVEYNVSLSTSVFAGISYQYGLSSVINKQAQNPSISQVMGYSDLLSVDLGIRF